MKVIMQESYMSLGEAGDVVEVKPGYARNFLLPQKLAVTATAANIKRFEDKTKEIATKKEKERDNSKKTLGLLENMQLTLKKKVSEEGKLFGAVTTKDLEAEFQLAGATIDRRQIVLGRQIKMVGEYSILVKLVGGLKATVPLNVVSDAPPKMGSEDNVHAAAAAPAPEKAPRAKAGKEKTKAKAEKESAEEAETSEEN